MMPIVIAMDIVSMIVQLTAAVLALRLIKVTGWRAAWVAIAVAIFLMFLRRSVGFYTVVTQPTVSLSAAAEHLLQFVISVLLVIGIALIAPVFVSIQTAKDRISEERNRARMYFDFARVMMVVIGPDQAVLQVNQKACEVLGFTSKEIIGRDWFDVFVPQRCQEEVRVVFRRLVEGGHKSVEHFENPVLTKSGEERIIDWRNTLLFDDCGRVTSILSSGEDITERRRAEEAKRALEEQLDKLKRKFYRETILSVTQGKLDICEPDDTEQYISAAQTVLQVCEPLDARKARQEAEAICSQAGLNGECLQEFVMGIGEAITNALKHCGGGCVYTGTTDGEVWAAVKDEGPGIESLILPSAVLRRGFSTRASLGLGYTIMLEVADCILLNTGTEGTTVVLIKRISKEEEEKLPCVPDTWMDVLCNDE
ncbi:MAG: PAS domain S-box protein [Armatimonadota bacterium]